MISVDRAKLILNTFNRQGSKLADDTDLNRLFVPHLWKEEVVEADSTLGKFFKILQLTKDPKSQERRIQQIFAQAIRTLSKQEDLGGFSLEHLVRFHKIIKADPWSPHHETAELPPLSEIPEIQAEQKKLEADRAEAIRTRSWLHVAPASDRQLDIQSFSQIFSLQRRPNTELQRSFINFLTRRHYSVDQIDDVQKQIASALECRDKLDQSFAPAGKPLNAAAYEERLHKSAHEMVENVQRLARGEKLFVCGSYGKQGSSLAILCKLIKKLSTSSGMELPPELDQFLDQEQLPNPTQMVASLIHEGFKSVGEGAPALRELLDNPSVQGLLPNAQRHLREGVAQRLPQFLTRHLESWQQQGLLAGAMEFVPDGELREFILWMSDKAVELTEKRRKWTAEQAQGQAGGAPDPLEELKKQLEERIIRLLGDPIQGVSETIEGEAERLFSTINQSCPLPLQKLLGFDFVSSSGQMWLEYQRQEDGNFTVLIYASGYALTQHRSEANKIEWPLRLTNVKPSSLRQDFFLHLLTHQYAPLCFPQADLSVEHLYAGLREHLQGKQELEPRMRTLDFSRGSSWEMTQAIYAKPDRSLQRIKLEWHREALIDFCRPLLQQDNLIVSSQAVGDALEHAVSILSQEAEILQGEDLRKWEATKEEIQQAIATQRKVAASSEDSELERQPLLQAMRGLIEQAGWSEKDLRLNKELIAWALGDEVGALIDHFLSSTTSPVSVARSDPAPPPANVPKHPRGWLGSILFSAYLHAAIRVFRLMMLLTRYYHLGVSALIEPFAAPLTRRVVPDFIQDWYAGVVVALRQKMFEVTSLFVLRLLGWYSREDALRLRALAMEWRKAAQGAAQTLLDNHSISFELSAPLPAPPSETVDLIPLTLPIEHTKAQDANTNKRMTLHRKPDEISAESLLPAFIEKDIIKSLKAHLEFFKNYRTKVLDNSNKIAFSLMISNLISKLEIPVIGKQGFWDQIPVEQIQPCIELLSEFNLLLHSAEFEAGLIPHVNNKELVEEMKKGCSSSTIISLYSLTAIMDRLARRVPEAHLEGFQIDITPLLLWMKSRYTLIKGPHLVDQLYQVVAYLAPDIDPDRLPSNEEIEERGKKCLFNTSLLPATVSRGKADAQAGKTLPVSVFDEAVPEFIYLQQRLQQDQILPLRLKSLGLHEDSSFYRQRSIAALWRESAVFTRRDSLLSPAYCFLRTQTLHANAVVTKDFGSVRWTWHIKEEPPPTSYEYSPEKLPTSLFGRLIHLFKLNALAHQIPDYASVQRKWPREGYELKFSSFMGITSTRYVKKVKDQQGDIHKKLSNGKQSADQAHWDMVEVESEDEVLRALGYFRKYPEDLYRLGGLSSRLFLAGKLRKQLLDSPQVAEKIGEVFTELLNYCRGIKDENRRETYWFLSLIGIQLKKYCKHYHPDRVHSFPDFSELFLQDIEESRAAADRISLRQLHACTLAESSKKFSEEQEKAVSLSILHAYFSGESSDHLPRWKTHSCFTGEKIESELSKTFNTTYSTWWPTIESYLEKDPDFRAQVAKTILQDKDIVFPESDKEKWEYSPIDPVTKKYVPKLVCGKLKLDFSYGTTLQEGISMEGRLEKVRSVGRKWFKESNQLCQVAEDRYQTPDGAFRVTVIPSKDKVDRLDLSYEKNIGGKWYQAMRTADDRVLLAKHPHWLERGDIENPQLVVLNQKYAATRQTFGFYQIEPMDEDEAGRRLQPIPEELFKAGLKPLLRFCPSSKIKCWTEVGTSRLGRIEFTPHELTFHIDKETRYAESTQFPGYFIASKQKDPALRSLASCLLLENSQKQQKVLIPKEQWLSAIQGRLLSYLGPFANFVPSELLAQGSSKGKCHEYDVEEERLLSKDPYDMACLVSLYLLAGDRQRAVKAFEDLEALFRLQPLSKEVEQSLMVLCVLTLPFPWAHPMRYRILAGMEQNRLVHLTESADDQETSRSLSLCWGVLACVDLITMQKEKNPRGRLTDAQEWFLFQRFFRSIRQVTKQHTKQLEKYFISSKSPKVSWSDNLKHSLITTLDKGADGIALAVLPSELHQRYEVLSKRYGNPISSVGRTVLFGSRFVQTPSSLPSSLSSLIPSPTIKSMLPQNSFLETLKEGCFVASEGQHLATLSKNQEFCLARLKKEMVATLRKEEVLKTEHLTPAFLRKHFLTYYAMAKNHYGFTIHTQCEKALTLAHHGVIRTWGKEDQLLVEYLLAVYNQPHKFKPYQELQEAISAPEQIRSVVPYYDQQEQDLETIDLEATDASSNHSSPQKKAEPKKTKFEEFFEDFGKTAAAHPHSGSLFWFGAGKVAKSMAKKAAAGVLQSAIGLPLLPIQLGYDALQTAWNTLYWASKALNTIAPASSEEAVAHPASVAAVAQPDSNFRDLDAEDDRFNLIFKDLFNRVFEEVPGKPPSRSFSPFEPDPTDAFLDAQISSVNQSLSDHYTASQAQPASFLKLKHPKHLWTLYLDLTALKGKFKKELNKEITELLALVNRNKPLHPVTLEDLKKYFAIRDQQKAGLSSLSAPALVKLDKALARYFARETRVQQLEQAISQIEHLSRQDPHVNRATYEEGLEKLAAILQIKRNYKFSELPDALIRLMLLMEFSSKFMLWEEQASLLQKVLLSADPNLFMELIPAKGKTSMLIPAISQVLANGEKLVFNIWPSQVAAPNTQQISKLNRKAFRQHMHALRVSRDKHISLEHLKGFYAYLRQVIEQRETINATVQDVQSLELLLLDFLERCEHESKKSAELEEYVLGISKLLLLIRTNGKLMGDEGHELINTTRELNYPTGAPATISESIFSVIEVCMQALLEDKQFSRLISENNLREMDLKEKESALQRIAERISTYGSFKIDTPAKKQEFLAFVLGNAETIPDWIKADKTLYREISMVRGILTELLPPLLPQKIDVDFGLSSDEIACLYEANMTPLERTTIKNPHEALVKTYISYFMRGLLPDQVRTLIKDMQESAAREQQTRLIPYAQTEAARLFAAWCPGKALFSVNVDSGKELAELTPHLQKKPAVLYYFIRRFIWKKILYWKRGFRSRAQDWPAMFHSQYLDSGTPYNHESYPSCLKMLWDPGTIGKALDIIGKKCGGVHQLQQSKPAEVLEEVLKNYFAPGSGFTALIDGGAQFHGLDNETVARKMMDYVRKHRPDIQVIDFYRRNPQTNRDELVSLQRNAENPVLFELCKAPLAARLSYFDQQHGFAANIPQLFNGKGLLLIGEQHATYRLLQEVFRMRGVKDFKKLLTETSPTPVHLEKENLEQTQTIHFALTPAVRQSICPDGSPPDLQKIVQFCMKNQGALLANINYKAYRQKIAGVLRRAILDKILTASSASAKRTIFKKSRDLLVPQVEDDPQKLYGLLKVHLDTSEIVEAVKKSTLAQAANFEIFTKEEQEGLRKAIEEIPQPLMPKQITAHVDGDKILAEVLDDMGQEVSQEQTVENNTENQREVQQEMEMHAQAQRSPVSGFKESTWSEEVSPASLEWLIFTEPRKRSSLPLSPLTPPLFRIQDLLRTSSSLSLQAIHKTLDSRLWCTNNFIPRIVQPTEKPVEIGSIGQRVLFQVLIQVKEEEGKLQIASVGCLSQADAAAWRRKLEKQRKSGEKLQVILYDMQMECEVVESGINLKSLMEGQNKKDWTRLRVMLKFLNGDADYTSEEIPILREWMRSQRINMIDAFQLLHQQRWSWQGIQGSAMDLLCRELQGLEALSG